MEIKNSSSETDERFEFGQNWKAFLNTLDESRISQAELSLQDMLNVDSLEGTTFLDIGSGSGLFSLAAHRMLADVTSFDFDSESVACTQELRTRHASNDSNWRIGQGSVLDSAWMDSLNEFDVVYSWGVLHHTGDMYKAIDAASDRVASGGFFFLAIYNDQGSASQRWLAIKKFYNRLPTWLRPVWVIIIAAWYELKFAVVRLARLKNPLPFADWRAKKNDRGMSAWHDWVEWIGGLPFEVAKPEEIIMPMREKGFYLEKLKTVGNGWGCNEYVFRRE